MKRTSCVLRKLLLCAVSTVLTATFTEANAQTPHKAKLKGSNTAQVPKAEKAPPAPTGPAGVGALKLGMTQSAIEALTAADGIYPLEPLTMDVGGTVRSQGGTVYKARMNTPLDPSGSVPVSFTFRDGKLAGFSIDLDSVPFFQSVAQIAAKYGEGQLSDNRKDDQCLYRNGANFKINSGPVTHRWTQRVSETESITTSAVELTIAFCPPSLAGPAFAPTTSYYIAFDDVRSDPTPKPNPF